MTKTCLRSAMQVVAGAVIGAGAALAEEPTSSHPADPVPIPSGPTRGNAFDLAVPMIDRPAAQPSYGPAPTEGAADPVEQMDQMMEMDHSGHQMPGMDHSGHQMPGANTTPGMNNDSTPENPQ